jgi:hypothetical protein
MKKITLIVGLTITAFTTTTAQSTRVDEPVPSSAKVVYAEIGGPGVASINYDMRFAKKEDGLGFRAGFGGFSIDEESIVFIPLGLNYITSKDKSNYFEIGAGITPIITSTSGEDPLTTTFGHLNIGYRKQPANGGFFFRAAINPIFGKGFFWPYYGGIGFGYKF